MATRIEDYGLIGDCTTAALVGRDGSIDWLCWPRFDSDACFTALLGTPEHGRWLIAPHDAVDKISRRYRPNTLVLETCFECAHGTVMLVDFMTLRTQGSNLIRLVVGQRGRVPMRTEFIVRFGYGAAVPWVSRIDEHTLRAVAGPDMLLLRTPAHLRGENMKTVGEFTIAEGETVPFVLSYSASHLPPPAELDALDQLRATEEYWMQWAGMTQISCPWDEAVTRSLITLKALTYAPTGGLVAAATTSLPEQFGGERNWDYRFCWLRDATLTLLALMNAGYYEEAHAWREWLLRAAAGSPHQLQIMYGIAGERRLTEWQVPWLPGYADARPVRIGNAAYSQAQLDVYGELMDVLHHARQGGLAATESGWALQIEVLKHLERVWREPDEGIWEVRSGREHFTYSKVMAWVAFDRAIKSADMFGLAGPVDHWHRLREQIHHDVCRHGFDVGLNCFVRSYGSRELDASLLLLPAVGFLPVQDCRIRGTVEAIERRLVVDGLVMRYDTASVQDGLPSGEGAFLPCSFWLVDVYAMLGRHDEAHRLFARLVSLCNDVGLLSEEYDPRTGRFAGNFPQAFSHLALVNSACNLGHHVKPAHQRGDKHVAVPG